jgi:hypothetical protein
MRFAFIHSMPDGRLVAEFRRDDGSHAQAEQVLRDHTQAAPVDVAAALRQLADRIAELA